MFKIKNIKKLLLVSFISVALFSSIMAPIANAQEWTYNGADTERIPHFSVYPSEWYVYNISDNSQKFLIYEMSHGNVSDLGLGNGYCVWINRYYQNATSGVLELWDTQPLSSWNDSIGYQGSGYLLPVEDDNKVSQRILDNVTSYWLSSIMTPGVWEHNRTYINPYSIAFWNDTLNNYFWYINYTENGIFTSNTWYFDVPLANMTLVSWPAQFPPSFSFTTEDGTLAIKSTDIKLNITITDADNNNDGVIDTDYLYRVKTGSTWTSWAPIPALIDYDLGSVNTGSYNITLEVKSMYGVTQESIIVQYTSSAEDQEAIPGSPTLLVALMVMLGVFIILFKYRKKW